MDEKMTKKVTKTLNIPAASGEGRAFSARIRNAVVFCCVFVLAFPIFAAITFGEPDLNERNEVLFSVKSSGGGQVEYGALMLERINGRVNNFAEILTWFPERMDVVLNNTAVEIRNKFGLARYTIAERKLEIIDANKVLAEHPTRVGPISVSPDGMWQCFVNRTSVAAGELIIREYDDSNYMRDISVSRGVGFSFAGVPAKWSPESDCILYEDAGNIYFLRTKDVQRGEILPKEYRLLGAGSINSVQWVSNKEIVYVDKDIIYEIPANALYLRSLYGAFMGETLILGRLPTDFNPMYDDFWIDSTKKKFVLAQSKKYLSCFTFGKTDNEGFQSFSMNPASIQPGTMENIEVFWKANGEPLVYVEVVKNRTRTSLFYNIENNAFKKITADTDLSTASISPNKKRVAFIKGNDVVIYEIDSQKISATLSGDKAVSTAWVGNTQLFVGGQYFIKLWQVDATKLSRGAGAAAPAARPAASAATTGRSATPAAPRATTGSSATGTSAGTSAASRSGATGASSTTAKPATTTAKPATTTAKPATTTAKPATTTAKPATTTAKPAATPAKPATATPKATGSAARKQSAASRTATTAKPAATPAKPATSTAKPATTTAKPATTTAKPATTTAKPATTTAKPATSAASTAKPATGTSAATTRAPAASAGTTARPSVSGATTSATSAARTPARTSPSSAAASSAQGSAASRSAGTTANIAPSNTNPGANGATSEVVLLSSVDDYFWDDVTRDIHGVVNGVSYLFDKQSRSWQFPPDHLPATKRAHMNVNDSFRVFLGNAVNENFANAIFVRNLVGAISTWSFFTESVMKRNSLGSVALVFDALDDASGLTDILLTLDSFDLKATFFINGEFLRRYPDLVKTILAAGHSCASMFYVAEDLVRTNVAISEDFIRRGLARNEDEFYRMTGKELALQWHTPFYSSNRLIRQAGANAGYTWIDKGLAPPDRVTIEDSYMYGAPYLSASQMLDNIALNLSNGAVVPVAVGVSGGRRYDYLYEKLDLLITYMYDAGFNIVTAEKL